MTARALAACASLLLLLACADDVRPVEAVWGKQPCDSCRMILSDPRSAAQLLNARGERRFFDDIGCLAEFLDEHPDRPRGVWVRSGGRWVDAEHTRFATGAVTPMDYGFAPSEQGTLDFSQVRRASAQKRKGSSR